MDYSKLKTEHKTELANLKQRITDLENEVENNEKNNVANFKALNDFKAQASGDIKVISAKLDGIKENLDRQFDNLERMFEKQNQILRSCYGQGNTE